MTWHQLGAVSPPELRDARLQLHHASQIVASAAITLLPPRPDDSHPNLGWSEPLGALLGRRLTDGGARVGLRPGPLSIVVVAEGDEVTEELPLDGATLEDGYAWLAAALERAGAKLPADGIERSAYEIPEHPTGEGAAFSHRDRPAFEELARWFANGDRVLGELADAMPGASEVRCWPHHFDLGSLVVEETDADGALSRSIGLGLSPGDGSYEEPYWYVSPWPYPDAHADALPALAGGGRWHTEGFTSAVLTGADWLSGAHDGQRERLDAFLGSAFAASRRILQDTPGEASS